MAGRLAAAAALLPLLAVVGAYSDPDCFAACFKNCVAKDKSMTDYCNYACGMTCGPDAALHRPLPAMDRQLTCVRESCLHLRAEGKDTEACYGQCYGGCNTKAGLPRPLRAGAGAGPVRPAALPGHPFHKMQDTGSIRPAALPDHPFYKMQDAGAIQPAALPDHPFHKIQNDDPIRPAALPDHPFHKMPAALPDHPFHKMPAALPDHPFHKMPAALPDHPFHKMQDVVQPTAEPDPDDRRH